MRDFWTLVDGGNWRRVVAVAFAPIVVLVAVGVGAIALGQDSRDGVLVTAAGQGQPVNEPVSSAPASSVPDPTIIPAPVPSVTVPTQPTATPGPVAVAGPLEPPAQAVAPSPVADDSTSESSQAQVTLANQFTGPVVVKVNGQSFTLTAGQRLGPVVVTPAASGNDIIEVGMASEPTCGVGDAQGYFRVGLSYVLTVNSSPGQCLGAPSPTFAVTPA